MEKAEVKREKKILFELRKKRSRKSNDKGKEWRREGRR